MITKEQLEELGFEWDGETKSIYTGNPSKFYWKKDKPHIIPGHDSLVVTLDLEPPFVTLTIEHQSSWTHTKEQTFKGKCTNIEFFKDILESCCSYY